METCDVLIAGGGPAGSTCAWALRQAGLDVVVMDRATFPRDKVCAGWITPQVLTDLRLDVHGYRHGRTFQPFTGFRVGLIGRVGGVEATYDHPVSFGIRRREFDEYLLQRSGARLRLGTPIQSIRRDGLLWTINECLAAPMLVGAGGHFCPVARLLNGSSDSAALVVAQEAEFAIDPRELSSFTTMPERPELYFSRALNGYGWCLRKENYLNIGFGHLANRLTHGRIEHAIHGNCAVVIKGKGREFHSISENTTTSASAAVVGEAAAPIYVTFCSFCSKAPTVKSSWDSVSRIPSFPQQLPVFRQSSQIQPICALSEHPLADSMPGTAIALLEVGSHSARRTTMAFMNEGTWDRAIRILAGIALGYAAWMTWPASVMSRPGAVSIVFLIIGAIAFVTGLVGWCPAYALFDVSTKKRVGA